MGGISCLAGDFMGNWSFDKELTPGDKIIFDDMIHYTTVKTTMFNGVNHPSVGIWNDKSGFRPDVKLSRDAYAQVKYLEAISSQDNAVLRLIYRACGALLKPSRILALILLTIVVFGLAFHLQAFQFTTLGESGQVVSRSLDWGEALYYSGISFTTIGYGDITPLGWARAAAIMEGLLGIVLAGSFLVSLVRKYAE
jgi:hypothetical protein